MSASPEIVQNCNKCGATIYPEHFSRGLAVRQAGKLLCRHCLEAAHKPAGPGESGAPLSMADVPVEHGSSSPALSGFTAVGASDAIYRKPANRTGTCRIRTFHAKLAEGAVYHLDEQVNTWLDAHPEVEIRFATTAVGVWEGKHPEPNLILTLYY